MKPHRFGRSQKYHALQRHLYALVFPTGHCYIGQTVDLKKRLAQHRSVRGGWAGAHFNMVPLSTIIATEAQASDHEAAWRSVAYRNGWIIYGKPWIVVDPRRRMTLKRRILAIRLRAPKGLRRKRHAPWWLALPTLALVVALLTR